MILDDFFTRALLAGIGMAIVAGPLGCFVIWRRLAYFGDTLAHSGLLGVTIGFILKVDLSLLGLLAHSSLAIGLVFIAILTTIRFDLMGLLLGDILSVTPNDIIIIWFGGSLILLILFYIWKSLFAATVSYDLAKAEGMNPEISNYIFTVILAGIIAISIKMIGVLLITGLLLIPPAMSRNFSTSPIQMMFFSIIGGILSVVIGLFCSLELNTPSGPSIIVASLMLFIISLFFKKGMTIVQKSKI